MRKWGTLGTALIIVAVLLTLAFLPLAPAGAVVAGETELVAATFLDGGVAMANLNTATSKTPGVTALRPEVASVDSAAFMATVDGATFKVLTAGILASEVGTLQLLETANTAEVGLLTQWRTTVQTNYLFVLALGLALIVAIATGLSVTSRSSATPRLQSGRWLNGRHRLPHLKFPSPA